MRFLVLGRLEVARDDGTPVTISGPARRAVLAALLCRAGSVATAAALIDDLWGAAPPRSALGTLRSHVARLRDDLGRDAAGAVLVTEGDGYRLNLRPGELDAEQFRTLVEQAGAIVDGNATIARYDQALALWRGDAYLDFGDAAFAVTERIRLAELRTYARERRTDLALAAGRTGELVPELEQRVRDEPYQERGWEQLALTLYRSGRQTEALDACRRARAVLVEDLGVEPGPGLRTLRDRLLQQDPALLGPRPAQVPILDRCPYLGLAGYDEGDAALFVGRERLTATLAGRLADQSVLIVTGASGVGKSSLIRAGLIPALRAGALPGSATWRIDVRTPTDGMPAGSHRPADLLVIDQAEELFTSLDPDLADNVAAQLGGFVDEGGRLLLVLRSDFYARLAAHPVLAPFADKSATLIGTLRPDELHRALVEPAAAAGLRPEPDLIETIMADVSGQAEPLPLLSEAMVRTWQNREGDLLTLEGYRRAGGLSGALEAAAEESFVALSDDARSAARHLLVRMATRSGSDWVGRPLPLSSLTPTDADRAALEALTTARLVTVAEHRVEIAHDALFVHWARLRDWLEERALAADLVEQLDRAATTWHSAGRHDADLYRGPRLSAALEWRDEHPEDVAPEEVEFLDASARAAQAELAAAREQAAREARGRRRLRNIAAGLAATVVLALAGGAVALHERGTARAQTNRAQQAALTADARRLTALSANAPDVATAALLAATAYRLQDTPDSEGALLAAVMRGESALFRIGTEFRPQEILVAPDGRRIYSLDQRRNVDVFDTVTRAHVTRYLARATDIAGLAANGTQIVVSGRVPGNDAAGDRRISVLSSADGSTVRVLTTDMNPDSARPRMTLDGRWLGAVLTGRTFAIYRAADWAAPPRQVPLPSPGVIGLAAGTSSFAVLLTDGTVEVVDAASGRITHRTRRAELATTPDSAGPFALSPDGTHIAATARGQDATPLLIDLTHPAAPAVRLPAQSNGVGELGFAPGNAEIAATSQSGAVAVYRVADGSAVSTFAGHAGPVHAIAWLGLARPTALYTAGLDSQIISWNLATSPRLLRQSGPGVPDPDHAELFGHLIVGATPTQQFPSGATESIYTLDETTGRYRTWALGPTTEVYVDQTVASADGHYALVSTENPNGGHNRIEIWDLRRGRQVGALQLPAASVPFAVGLNAAISPDGHVAVSSLNAHSVGVFDVPSGRLLRTYPVRFSRPDADRIDVVPWQFDPAGHLLLGGYDSGPPQAAPPGAPTNATPADPANQRFALMDVATGRILAQTGLGDIILPTAVAWSHDGKLLALGTRRGTLELYDAATLQPRASAGVIIPGAVQSVSFSPDDRSLVAGGTDAEMAVFTVPDLNREGTRIQFAGTANGDWFAFYNPRGDIVGLAPTGANGDRLRWFTFPARSSELLSTACQLAGADITPQQWTRYVGPRPYRHVCALTR